VSPLDEAQLEVVPAPVLGELRVREGVQLSEVVRDVLECLRDVIHTRGTLMTVRGVR
jgi:hypothetical protein